VTVYHDPIDCVEARGLGFSEMQTYWSLPFHDFAVVGDISVIKDPHGRQLKVRVTIGRFFALYMISNLEHFWKII
jgi:hypothetical protein